jgi:hypothetical protein
MWPFDSAERRAPRLAGAAAYARLFEQWSRADHRELVANHQLGFVRARHTSRRRPVVPLLQLLLVPGGSIDFADPRTGWAGLGSTPPRDRVLTLWADDLLSVRHGDDWIYVIDADEPLAPAWLGLLDAPAAPARPRYAVVTAAFEGRSAPGEFRVADVAATAPTTLVRVEDRRRDVSGGRVAARGRAARPT